jgi:uncharacterized protein involved in exopolysaccharide biosynthesis
VIGGIVAFFVPRYYVAKTTVVYQGHALDPTARTKADPFQALVLNATLSIPATVPDVFQKLGWLEARDENEERRLAFMEEVKSRIVVKDLNTDEAARSFVNLEISYRDTDGGRSADFVNLLRDTWIDLQQAKFADQADRALRFAQDEVRAAQQSLNIARRDLTNFMRTHDIDPRDENRNLRIEQDSAARQIAASKGRLAEASARVNQLESQRELHQRRLTDGTLTRDIVEQVPVVLDAVQQRRVAEALERLQRYARFEGSENHPQYSIYVKGRQEALAEIEKLKAEGLIGSARTVVRRSEEYEALEGRLREVDLALRAARDDVERLSKELTELESVERELPRVWEEYLKFQEAYRAAEVALEDRQGRVSEYRARYEVALTGNPFSIIAWASPPPRPTEPNITLVALGGCLIGLGIAIGLVLLLDMLRSTFKTLDDVERALPVPVLGAMAHLETVEQRTRITSYRRRVSLVAGAFVVVVVSIVTIYYVAPTRLPPGVLQALEILLGAPR